MHTKTSIFPFSLTSYRIGRREHLCEPGRCPVNCISRMEPAHWHWDQLNPNEIVQRSIELTSASSVKGLLVVIEAALLVFLPGFTILVAFQPKSIIVIHPMILPSLIYLSWLHKSMKMMPSISCDLSFRPSDFQCQCRQDSLCKSMNMYMVILMGGNGHNRQRIKNVQLDCSSLHLYSNY